MISLFIDTCTSNLIIAVCKGNQILKQVIQENNNDLSTNFTSFVETLLNGIDLKVKDVKKVFVSVGPGSFTGIRIGLTFAKVLAWSLNIPIVPVSSLEVLASGFDNDIIVPILNARRGYVYGGIYNKNLDIVLENKYIYLEELNLFLDKYDSKIFVSCDQFNFDVNHPNYQIDKVIKKHENDLGVNPHSLVPWYLKKTEAEEKLGAN